MALTEQQKREYDEKQIAFQKDPALMMQSLMDVSKLNKCGSFEDFIDTMKIAIPEIGFSKESKAFRTAKMIKFGIDYLYDKLSEKVKTDNAETVSAKKPIIKKG